MLFVCFGRHDKKESFTQLGSDPLVFLGFQSQPTETFWGYKNLAHTRTFWLLIYLVYLNTCLSLGHQKVVVLTG